MFTHKKIGKAFLVSREMLEDDLFKVIAQKPQALARSIRHKIEYDTADILNNSDVTTNNTGADGKELAVYKFFKLQENPLFRDNLQPSPKGKVQRL